MLITEQIKCAQQDVEATLNRYFEQPLDTEHSIKQATHYSVLNGGKRLRPFLVYATGKMLGANKQDLDVLAAAIECIHSYSLVHDDLPAMDDDDLRRGRPTCHIVYGEAHAILAGDALQTLAFDLIANHSFNVPAQQQLKMIAALAKASGIEGMVGGQALDIAATDKLVNLAELERIHKLKTGALLNCAITLGALCAADTNQQTLLQLKQFGDAIGLAFQVQDDILDIEGDTQVLGKPQGSDVAANKATYPALLGLTGAKQKAQSLLKCALDALAAIDADTSELENLAKYIVERDY
ncbi:(2E,6E)-farnesyl diphosphate synthase [Pseudoalteromonas sp. SR44-5]|uniref:(2E,6E)-farnesyl diphosphate synthase n=1 Tax=Pseudoalteromonas rhizosphaerae TaxID=2518973 RepID=A0ABW8L318_9GAMM|nr:MULTISPECIES: farnesyl diphosphate synthase [unclassified Pseudoalteromonas]MBB1333618.1 (2E,6E)-farnesyl diphosphate synthase [Pseudoalteromonas sp. SR41-6]MBB1341530.1 (2E,6E)-farnesyl diphosphate synthase [Pseudoalteromonas sp. SR45-6]MBB1366921.1 (2E,6E)-farnesyl diphosphate synthase [Pseudoalteromonas sp. SR44-5]MBB1417877.1 (2E,6E)-farnesyl diphosphate synthase [Pseudoalteromonas sp. SG44-1]MBB1422611.1 (2E,6E)-farnesyl diphosphate synthase [Pseudoalteromonas sp. SG43-7]